MAYEIEKGIEIPKSVNGANKYPFNTMEIGDSFSFPYSEKTKVTPAASYAGTLDDKKFSIRKISETEGRCWRIA